MKCRLVFRRSSAPCFFTMVLAGAWCACGSGQEAGTVVEIQPGDPGNPDGRCPIPAEALQGQRI